MYSATLLVVSPRYLPDLGDHVPLGADDHRAGAGRAGVAPRRTVGEEPGAHRPGLDGPLGLALGGGHHGPLLLLAVALHLRLVHGRVELLGRLARRPARPR